MFEKTKNEKRPGMIHFKNSPICLGHIFIKLAQTFGNFCQKRTTFKVKTAVASIQYYLN